MCNSNLKEHYFVKAYNNAVHIVFFFNSSVFLANFIKIGTFVPS